MKKILLGTTAIVAAGMIAAPSADAADKIDIAVGGFMNQWFGYTTAEDESADYQGFNNKSNTEIHFTGTTKLDNGISLGVGIELEGNSSSSHIDESYATISGNFGKFTIGSNDSSMSMMHVSPTNVGAGVGDTWVPNSIDAAFADSTDVTPDGNGDSEKVTYMTPSIKGFQLGLSYLPDNKEDNNGARDSNAEVTDGYTIGASFNHDFDGDFNIAMSLGYGAFTDGPAGQDDPNAFSAGLTVGFGGFSIGGSYGMTEGTSDDETSRFSLGAAYEMGPWGFSANYFHSDGDGTTTGNVITNDGDHDTFSVNGSYTFGPGVTAAATLGHTEISTDNTAAGTNDEIDGTYFVVGVKLSF